MRAPVRAKVASEMRFPRNLDKQGNTSSKLDERGIPHLRIGHQQVGFVAQTAFRGFPLSKPDGKHFLKSSTLSQIELFYRHSYICDVTVH